MVLRRIFWRNLKCEDQTQSLDKRLCQYRLLEHWARRRKHRQRRDCTPERVVFEELARGSDVDTRGEERHTQDTDPTVAINVWVRSSPDRYQYN